MNIFALHSSSGEVMNNIHRAIAERPPSYSCYFFNDLEGRPQIAAEARKMRRGPAPAPLFRIMLY
jgi:hypothetical protein